MAPGRGAGYERSEQMNDPRADEPKDDLEHSSEPVEEHGEDRPSQPDTPQAHAPEAPAAAPQASTGRSFSVALGMFALLVSIAAVGGVVFTWLQVAEQRELVVEQRSEASATLAAIRELVAATQERVAAQEERLGALDRETEERRREFDGLDAELRQARAHLDTLVREDAGPERSPSLAEIEFLLLLARRELVLGDNPRVALAALREADQRLARLDEPGLMEVRAAINDEIAAVEAVADVDLDGIAMRLASLAGRVDGLPLRASLAPEPRDSAEAADEAGWARLGRRMRSAAADLFRIRRTDAPVKPLLAPDESFFLYRNIELDLKSARLAVFARDRENYAASLAAAQHGLAEYFETGDPAVQSLVEAIVELEERDIAPQWPEISRSLELLRATGATD